LLRAVRSTKRPCPTPHSDDDRRDLFDGVSDDPRFVYDGEPANLQGQVEGLNFRCAYEATQEDSADLVQPIERFVNGLLSLKGKARHQVVYAALVGVPKVAESMLAARGQVQDFAGILALEEMQIRPGDLHCTARQMQDPDFAGRCGKPALDGEPLARPACTSSAGSAVPGRRFVQVAKGLAERGEGEQALVGSICSEDYRHFTNELLSKIGSAVERACTP
jgi:hypothetical protein